MTSAVSAGATAPLRPRIVIDASNVCASVKDARGAPRLSNLLAVRAALDDLDFETTTICDANLRYIIDDGDGLQQLMSRGDVQQSPAGCDADVFILDAAARLGARVLSNDVYRQHLGRFPWVAERRVSFMLVGGKVLIPSLAVGAVRPLRGVEEPADRTDDNNAVIPTAAPDRQRSLVQGLLAENEALRTQRDRLLAECDDLRSALEAEVASVIEANSACSTLRSEAATHQARHAELTAKLSEAEARLTAEAQSTAAALADKQHLEFRVAELHQRELTLSGRVAGLERALAAVRPDAQLEQKVDKLLRETLRTLKSQSEPINRTQQHAMETRKAVAAVQSDTHKLAQHAEAISKHLAQRNEASDGTEPEPVSGEAWSTRYARVEQAWLAHQMVGDRPEAACFLKVVETLRRVNHSLDDERLLEQVDALAARVGEGFSYAALWEAVAKTHNPSLESGVLLARTRDAVRANRGRTGRSCVNPFIDADAQQDGDSR